jgi:predicted DNA-binding transcriptional regulator AlpA
MQEQLLTTSALARHLGVSVSTLMQYRQNRAGPKYIKIGHLVRYRMTDINAWLDGLAQ